ncbi:DUF2306 domain-containing protein [Phenylobacterium sp.]|jgi:hypothetical protein|uniref:DUF2306 domain-containing protein n=1 Tax=Phenylobacterium sp. TaxID=1871053 RepID=UPI002F3F7289
MNPYLSRGLWWIGAVTSVIIALISYRYFVPSIPTPTFVGGNAMAHPWLWVHAGFGATSLILGPWQFLPRLRARWPRVHRWIGRGYVVSVIVGGCAGLLLASGTTAGPIARAGFSLLAIVSVGLAANGWRLAMSGRYAEHREWMVRSFAVIFGAVLLRAYLPIAQGLFHIPFMPAYRAIAWLAWVPNLIVAELYLRGAFRPRRPAPAAA